MKLTHPGIQRFKPSPPLWGTINRKLTKPESPVGADSNSNSDLTHTEFSHFIGFVLYGFVLVRLRIHEGRLF
jgi:hypothetical protein